MTTPGDEAGGHPELEELAALIDGRLSAGRAVHVRAHLASCEECREVFFETVDFVREEEARKAKAALLPFERPVRKATWKSRLAVALPTAAVLALSASLVYVQFFAPPRVAWAKLASNLGHRPKKLKYEALHDPIMRGIPRPGGEISQQSFRLGVALVNLQVSLEGEKQTPADNALAKINGLNELLEQAPEVKKFYINLHNRLPQHLRPWAERAEKMADSLRGSSGGTADDLYLDFGLWSEAGHIAAAAEDERFLTSRDNRRFPTYLRRKLKKDGDKLPSEVEAPLQEIEKTLDRDRLTTDDYRRLGEYYEEIMRFYDRETPEDQ